MIQIDDIHTHRPDAPVTSVRSVVPGGFDPQPGYSYSVGMHPWYLTERYADEFPALDAAIRHPQVVAIGETGIDKRRSGINLEDQLVVFERHIALSETVGKPLIIHSVHAFDEIVRSHKLHAPRQPWIIHGFRGKPRLALQLLQEGFFLSYGERYNEESLSGTPVGRLLIETDESAVSVSELYRRAADQLGMPPGELYRTVSGTASDLFTGKAL